MLHTYIHTYRKRELSVWTYISYRDIYKGWCPRALKERRRGR